MSKNKGKTNKKLFSNNASKLKKSMKHMRKTMKKTMKKIMTGGTGTKFKVTKNEDGTFTVETVETVVVDN
jgi:hypothetical protein